MTALCVTIFATLLLITMAIYNIGSVSDLRNQIGLRPNLTYSDSSTMKSDPITLATNVTKSKAKELFILPYAPIPVNFVTFDDIHNNEDFTFNVNGSDVMVFLHIQKTGGTAFGKHLVQDTALDQPCVCRKLEKKPKSRQHLKDFKPLKKKLKCDCFRPGKREFWLFSRYSTGWKCGLHPDWTELTACVDHFLDGLEGHSDHRRYFYVSFLRDPVNRYLSEFKHVQRGATWKTSMHLCNGRSPTEEELPSCYPDEEDWMDVELPEFMACGHNLAANRQTRMLADLKRVNCYNTTGMTQIERDLELLKSAKENLLKLSFFGLTELQLESQYLFQETFNIKFNVRFVQFDHDHAHTTLAKISNSTVEKIKTINHLDVQLYEYAQEVLKKRFETLKAEDVDFDNHYAKMGMLNEVPDDDEYEEEEEEDYYTESPNRHNQ